MFSFSPSIFSKASQSFLASPKPTTETASCSPSPQNVRCEPPEIGPPLKMHKKKCLTILYAAEISLQAIIHYTRFNGDGSKFEHKQITPSDTNICQRQNQLQC